MSSSHADLAITVPTLVGSVLSTIAIVVVLSLHAISPPRRHVRHALIINLLLCDLADMINNTISGSLALKYGPLDQVLTKGQCTANAPIYYKIHHCGVFCSYAFVHGYQGSLPASPP
ncbi:hypothetical protein FOVSG1_013706 [Fusarium oxysporum f. sp. vasinfectum]